MADLGCKPYALLTCFLLHLSTKLYFLLSIYIADELAILLA